MECIKCGAVATKRYSPDLDINGIGMCAEHTDEVMMDLMVTQFDKKRMGKSLRRSIHLKTER